MTIATDMFERRMQSIARGDRAGFNRRLAEQLWKANPSEHSDFLLIAYNNGILEWEADRTAVTEVKLFDMDVLEFCPPIVISSIGYEEYAYE